MLTRQQVAALNRLLILHYRSLPMYLADAAPWTQRGDEQAIETLRFIVADHKEFCRRIIELLLSEQAQVDEGEFPITFTDSNDLSLDFLLLRMMQAQLRDLQAIQNCSFDLREHWEAHRLAEESLGAARAHLDALQGLVAKLATPFGSATINPLPHGAPLG